MLAVVLLDPECTPVDVLPFALSLAHDVDRLDVLVPFGDGPRSAEVWDSAADLTQVLDTELGPEGWTADAPPEDAPEPEEGETRPPHIRFLRVGTNRCAEGTLDHVRSEKADRLILVQQDIFGSTKPPTKRRRFLLDNVTCPVMVLRPGKTLGRDALLAVARGPHARAALIHGEAHATAHGGITTAVKVEPSVGEDAQGIGVRILNRVLTKALGERAADVRRQVFIDDVPANGLEQALEASPEAWVWLGMSRKTKIGRYLRSTTTLRLAQRCPGATLVLVRVSMPLAGRLLGRIEASMLQRVPQLGRDHRLDLVERVQSNSHWDFDFKVLMCLSTFIATFGLVANAPAVIIGAMLVAPLMTPLLGMGIALVQGNTKLAKLASRSVLAGFLTAFAIGWIVGVLHPHEIATEEMRMRNWPGLVDLAVAFVSGLAAAYASSRANLSAALPGVAIAAALVPPIATSGLALAMGDFSLCLGAALLFGTNLVTIVLASAAALWSVGLRTGQIGSKYTRRMGLLLGAAAFVLVVWLAFAPPAYRAPFRPSDEVRAIVAAEMGEDFELVSCRFERLESPRLLSVVVSGASAPPAELAERIRLALVAPVGHRIEIRLEGRLIVRATQPELPTPSPDSP
tara:strand:- start:11540 stop:13426 length:1887 start_codon:yes stop_codon:yes gene_type:complete